MTLSADTIRTVIEIVPDWATRHKSGNEFLFYPPDCGDDEHLSFCSWHYPQWILDALAAVAVVAVLEKGFDVQTNIQGSSFEAPGMWIEITDMELSETHRFERDAHFGPSVNTLEAIAEFVNKHGELFK